MDLDRSIAFLSYTHADNKDKYLTEFCQRFSIELGLRMGLELEIFQDYKNIRWGESWRDKIQEALAQVTFFIPIITPRYFYSEECQKEFREFLRHEQRLQRTDLVLPLYYIDCPLLEDSEMENEANPEIKELVDIVKQRNYVRWQDLRLESFDSSTFRRTLADLVAQIMERAHGVRTLKENTNRNGDQTVSITSLQNELKDIKEKLETYSTKSNKAWEVVQEYCGRDLYLENRIKDLFKDELEDVLISINQDVSFVAARLFEYLVRPSLSIKDRKPGVAFSGGKAVQDMVMRITQRYDQLAVYPLSCAGLPEDISFSADAVISAFCRKYPGVGVEGRNVPITVEAAKLIGPSALNDLICQMEKDIRFNVDYAFTGIGNVKKDSAIVKLYKKFYTSNNPQEIDVVKELTEMNIVGDILYRAIGSSGNIIPIQTIDSRVVGINPSVLQELNNNQKTKKVKIVGVASGADKAEPILAAIRGKYINILATDESAAQRIIDLEVQKRMG